MISSLGIQFTDIGLFMSNRREAMAHLCDMFCWRMCVVLNKKRIPRKGFRIALGNIYFKVLGEENMFLAKK